jgi:hypothetical protein
MKDKSSGDSDTQRSNSSIYCTFQPLIHKYQAIMQISNVKNAVFWDVMAFFTVTAVKTSNLT